MSVPIYLSLFIFEDLYKIFETGFGFLQMGCALIYDPEFINKTVSGIAEKPLCDQYNRCVAAMDGGGVYCVSKEIGYLE